MSSISKSQIEYVLALERTGSFSEAAELCFVTQSTLSTMIKKLEEQIGLILFDRKSKPISLTQEGQKLIAQFKVIFYENENLSELIQEVKEELYGSLKIGIIPTLAPFLLPLFLDKLVNRYSNVHFTIHEITTNEIVALLHSREIDLGILSTPLYEKGIHEKSLFTEEFLVYDAGDNHKRPKKYKIADIDVSRLWLLEESHCLSHQIGQICHLRKKRKISQNLEYKSGSILSLLHLVKVNKGLTLVPKLASSNKILDPSNLVPLEDPRPAREIGLVTQANFTKKRLLNILEREIVKAVKPYLDLNAKYEVVKPI